MTVPRDAPGLWLLLVRATCSRPLPLRALLFAALTASLWILGTGLLHTSTLLSSAYSDIFCDGGDAMPLWLAEIHHEQDHLVESLLSVRQQSEALLGAANATAYAAVRKPVLSQQPQFSVQHSFISAAGGNATSPFLFVGVLSVPRSRERRDAVRQTWMKDAGPEVAVRFVMYEEEADEATLGELATHGDVIFVPGAKGTDYRSIVYKTFALVQWVTRHSRPKFVLKTDDDAYVHTSNLVAALRKLCQDPDCAGERLYMGAEKRNGIVITEDGNKWSNLEYFQLTGIREYAPYMFGGGYIFSADVARALHEVNAIAPLQFMPNEDATFGFWVMGMDLRHVDQPMMRTAAGQCCFFAVPDRDASGRSMYARVRTHEDMCSGWLVLHKVEGSDQMRYLHFRMQRCPRDQANLAWARELALERQTAAPPAIHMRPLQMYAMTNWRHGFHFFGRNDVDAWSHDSSRLLRCRTQQLPHDMEPSDSLAIGYIPFSEGAPLTMEHSGWGWRPLAVTRAWSYRLGPRAQWLGGSRSRLVYNDRACANATSDQLCSVVFHADRRVQLRQLPRPVYSVAPDGSVAASFCFKRLHVAEPGWGYAASAAALRAATTELHPANDGLWLMDTQSGASRLLISLQKLFEVTFSGKFSWHKDAATGLQYHTRVQRGGRAAARCLGWVAAAVFSRDGDSVALLYRVGCCAGGTLSFLYTIDIDGKRLWRVPSVEGGDMDYGHDGKLLVCDATGTHLVDNRKGVLQLQKPVAIRDEGPGPCRLFGDANQFLLGDTYHEPHKLYVWDLYRSEVHTLSIMPPADWPGPGYARASLNPQWSPNGQVVALDSSFTWETGLQTYVVGVQHLQAGVQRPLPPPYVRHLYCDLAVRSGRAMAHFVQGELEPWRWQVHAFQAAGVPPTQEAALARNVEGISRVAGNVTLHPEAAGTQNRTAVINSYGVSRFDVSISDVQTTLLPGPDAPARHPSWWRARLSCHTTGSCDPAAGPAPAPAPAAYAERRELQELDFSAWLKGQAEERDHVVLTLALGEGRDFELLAAMLREGALLLVDKIYVHWHFQLATWHELASWEFIFSLLNIPFEYIDFSSMEQSEAI